MGNSEFKKRGTAMNNYLFVCFCGHTHVLKKLVCGSLLPKNGCVVFLLYASQKLGGAVLTSNFDLNFDLNFTSREVSNLIGSL